MNIIWCSSEFVVKRIWAVQFKYVHLDLSAHVLSFKSILVHICEQLFIIRCLRSERRNDHQVCILIKDLVPVVSYFKTVFTLRLRISNLQCVFYDCLPVEYGTIGLLDHDREVVIREDDSFLRFHVRGKAARVSDG